RHARCTVHDRRRRAAAGRGVPASCRSAGDDRTARARAPALRAADAGRPSMTGELPGWLQALREVFAWPWWLLAMPLPWCVWRFMPARRSRDSALRVPYRGLDALATH